MRMMKSASTRSGQSMAEYAIVLTVVIGAIVAMQLFVKRGLQGKVKDATDMVSIPGAPQDTKQFEPNNASSDYTVTQSQKSNDQYNTGGTVFRDTQKEDTTRTGKSEVAAPK